MDAIGSDDDDERVERRQSTEDDSIVLRIEMNKMKSKTMNVFCIDFQGAPCKEDEWREWY